MPVGSGTVKSCFSSPPLTVTDDGHALEGRLDVLAGEAHHAGLVIDLGAGRGEPLERLLVVDLDAVRARMWTAFSRMESMSS